MKIKPTALEWSNIKNFSEIIYDGHVSYKQIEYIDFKNSEIKLVNGRKINFDCFNEQDFKEIQNFILK